MLDVVETANRLIKKHGESATEIAAAWADKLHDSGREQRCQQWKEVVIETKVLLARDYAE